MAFDPSWITMGLGAVSGLGGLFGGGSNSEQRGYIGKGLGTYDSGLGALQRGQERTLEALEEANMVLAGIEPAVLAGMDEQLRVRVAQQVMTDRQNFEAQQQRLASAGLDSTTVAPSMQRGQAFGQSQQTANTAAAFAGQRASAIAGARTNYAQGLARNADVQMQFAGMRNNLIQNKANAYMGIQVEPRNDAAAIGALGGNITNAMYTQFMLESLRGGQTPGAGWYPGKTPNMSSWANEVY